MTTLGAMTGVASTGAGGTQTDAARTAQDAKLMDAAQGFEAIFLQEMLKPLRTAKEDAGEDKDQSAGGDTLSSFGTESLAKAIAKSGGMGIAKQIVQKVSLERTERQQGEIRKS